MRQSRWLLRRSTRLRCGTRYTAPWPRADCKNANARSMNDLTFSAFRAAQQGLGRNAADWHWRFENGIPVDWDAGVVYVRQSDGRIILLRPQLRRHDVLSLFKAATTRLTTRFVKRPEIGKWYRDRVENWPDGEEAPSADDDFHAARAVFRNVPRQEVRDVRRELAPKEWQARGRRKRAEKSAEE
jgi:hypothetical protein